jgi:hypothetical protein
VHLLKPRRQTDTYLFQIEQVKKRKKADGEELDTESGRYRKRMKSISPLKVCERVEACLGDQN